MSEIILNSLEELTPKKYQELIEAISYIDETKIATELSTQPYRFSYWSKYMADAKRDLDKAKMDLEIQVALIQEDLINNSQTKLTDKKLNSKVMADPMYSSLRHVVTDKEYKYNLLRNITEALKQRKDMLIQLSANNRKETDLYT